MFTGIISAIGKVASTTPPGASKRVRSREKKDSSSMRVGFERPRGWNLTLGDSVNVNGICSTVSRITAKTFEVEYMPETLAITTAPLLKKGMVVNLERSLRLSDRLDGHIVQGHVDTMGTVLKISRAGRASRGARDSSDSVDSAVITVSFPPRYKKFIAKKGSICVNGVSLTVVEAGKDWFSISLVHYTLTHTNLQNLAKGDKVNLEVDVMARYLDALKNN